MVSLPIVGIKRRVKELEYHLPFLNSVENDNILNKKARGRAISFQISDQIYINEDQKLYGSIFYTRKTMLSSWTISYIVICIFLIFNQSKKTIKYKNQVADKLSFILKQLANICCDWTTMNKAHGSATQFWNFAPIIKPWKKIEDVGVFSSNLSYINLETQVL